MPTSGQGACQALEDAWHLTNCLIEDSEKLNESLSKFTKLRFEKTTGIISAGRGLASTLFNTDAEFCIARNENSKKTDFSLVSLGMAKTWSRGLPLNA